MLKVKEDIDLEELKEKYGEDIDFEEDDGCLSFFNIDPKTRELSVNCSDCFYSGEVNIRAELLYDLIISGAIIKE